MLSHLRPGEQSRLYWRLDCRGARAQGIERRIEIELTIGRHITVDASVDVEALGRIVEARIGDDSDPETRRC
jgi:hypothetical protein